MREALALGEALASEPVELGVATQLARTQETLAVALGNRDVPRIVMSGLDEIGFGSFEGGQLADYRAWAWTNEPDALCPGGGESRVHVAERLARSLDGLLARPEKLVVVVSHALPVRYILDASDGNFPAARIGTVPHATPFRLDAEAVELAAETLRVWATAPRFADADVG